MRAFSQVDVFTDELGYGNPVAVVHDADGLDDEQLAAFARWTNLSETTFLLPPDDPSADYRLRIFTAARELPFAGHPTLGSARAWLEAGGVPKGDGHRAGVRRRAGPHPSRRRPAWRSLRRRCCAAGRSMPLTWPRSWPRCASTPDDVVDAQWADNGPGWVALLLRDADAVLAVEPDWAQPAQRRHHRRRTRPDRPSTSRCGR